MEVQQRQENKSVGISRFLLTKSPFKLRLTALYVAVHRISHFFYFRESNLLAISLDDLNIEIIDIMTRKIVRKFLNCHQNPITDITFSQDSRWLITSSLDKTVKVWDVPTGSLIGESYECFVRKGALLKHQSQSEVIKVMLQFHT